MKKFQVVTVGDVVIDEFLTMEKGGTQFQVNTSKQQLCIPYGQKISVESCRFLVGGNASNVAVGLARLGLRTAVYAEVGFDDFSKMVERVLVQEGVAVDLLKRVKDSRPTFSIGIHFNEDRTLFVEHIRKKHDFVFDGFSTDWVYLTSLGKDWKKAYDSVLSFVNKKKLKLAFNPGSSQVKEGIQGISRVLNMVDLLYINKEEALNLGGMDKKTGIKDLLSYLKSFGAKNIVVTDGKGGSYALDTAGIFHTAGIFPNTVVEKTGAGDGYAAGFLYCIMQGGSFEDAMRFGGVNAASVIGFVGAQEGLLDKGAIEKALSRCV